jgi:hypothetical protein
MAAAAARRAVCRLKCWKPQLLRDRRTGSAEVFKTARHAFRLDQMQRDAGGARLVQAGNLGIMCRHAIKQ